MDNKKENSQSIECPICSKEFSSDLIEIHVSKCLFLTESTNETSTPLKRSPAKDHLLTKKIKQDVKMKEDGSDLNKPDTLLPVNKEGNEIVVKKIKVSASVPLAEKMRPNDITSYIGQVHVLGPETVLYQLLNKSEIPNIILWGPPGCGKTSLANIIANTCKLCPGRKYRFVKLSATMSGVNDIKEIVTLASNDLKFGCRTIIFLDEIHRFNKIQQDIFLPNIESGVITLIGATTENPSFSLNSALLSRCRVIVLEKLSVQNLMTILENAVRILNGCICDTLKEETISKNSSSRFFLDKATIKWLAETSDGDARIALGGLELAIQSKVSDDKASFKENLISLNDIKESLKKSHMLYDKKGDQHYDLISALHKSVRASDENASLYWLTRMLAGGEDPVYIARRLVRMASEDVGLADPKALGVAVQTMHACKMLGMPDCDTSLAQCTTYLARAPKSRLMEDALRAAQYLVSNYDKAQPSVPLHLRNAPTKLMSNLGYGKGYNMLHKDESDLTYLPPEIGQVNFFNTE